MRLFGVAMVRDEADVIEAFVRHNLSLLDGLAIVDHGSIDGTSDILAKLQAEGLALRVIPDAEAAFFQSLRMTEVARETLAREHADFVFALDADESLKIESRPRLERVLAVVPPGLHALARWLTDVPDDFETADGAFGPGHLWRRLETERHAMHKAIVGRSLLDQPEAFITGGNHVVSMPGAAKPPPHARLPSDVVAYAHCPVRSREQLTGKSKKAPFPLCPSRSLMPTRRGFPTSITSSVTPKRRCSSPAKASHRYAFPAPNDSHHTSCWFRNCARAATRRPVKTCFKPPCCWQCLPTSTRGPSRMQRPICRGPAIAT
jgi:hypothetical protein